MHAVADATAVYLGPLDNHVYTTIEAPWVALEEVKLGGSLKPSFHIYAIGERNPKHRIVLTTCQLTVDLNLIQYDVSQYTYDVALVRPQASNKTAKVIKSVHLDTGYNKSVEGMVSVSTGERIKVDLPPDVCQAYDKQGGLRLVVTPVNAHVSAPTPISIPLPTAYFHGFMHKANQRAQHWQRASVTPN